MSDHNLPGYHDVLTNAAFAPITDGGRFRLTGPDARDFLHRMVSNDILSLPPGGGARAAVLTIDGRMLADLHAWILDEETVLVETDAAACDALIATLEKYIIMERVEVEDLRGSLALVTVQGPESLEAIGEALLTDIPELGPLSCWRHGEGDDALLVCGRDRTGQGGYDLYAAPLRAAWLPQSLGPAGVQPLAEEALDTLRIEAGIAKWGRELNETVIPLEANLEGVSVSFTKGCYPGQEIIARIHSRGRPAKNLAGIRFEGGPPAPGATIEQGGETVGAVTSSALSPRFGAVALAYLRKETGEAGAAVSAEGIPGTVVELPFAG